MGFCKEHTTRLPTSDDHRNILNRKAHWSCGSREGQLRATMAVPIGCQVSAEWHVPLHLRAHSALTSRDGTVAEHSLAVRQCGDWWRAARWGIDHERTLPERGDHGTRICLCPGTTYAVMRRLVGDVGAAEVSLIPLSV